MEAVMQGKLKKLVNGDTWLAEEYHKRPVPIIDRYFDMVDTARVFLVVLRKAATAGYSLTVEDVVGIVEVFDRIDARAESLGIKFPKMKMLKDRFAKQLANLVSIAVAQKRNTTPLVALGTVPRKEEVVST